MHDPQGAVFVFVLIFALPGLFGFFSLSFVLRAQFQLNHVLIQVLFVALFDAVLLVISIEHIFLGLYCLYHNFACACFSGI